MLNVLQNTSLMRRLQLALYGFGTLAAVTMTVASGSDARLPWFIVVLYSVGCFADTARNETPAR